MLFSEGMEVPRRFVEVLFAREKTMFFSGRPVKDVSTKMEDPLV
jgi:hypothetical protein